MNHTREGTILGHPKGLFVLFFTEMWERFSYYGMRALLVLYLVNIFKMTQEDASRIYKWYTALVYLTPLAGGYLADRYLGNKWAIVIGSILMAIGQFVLGTGERSFFMIGLGFLIVGNGFFKPNMSVQVGRLYPQNDPRRDGAYTIFYMGINLGAFFAPIICGALMDTPALGYEWGFAAAGVGMVLGLLIYLFGLRWIRELPEGAQYQAPTDETARERERRVVPTAMTEEQARTAPSAAPAISNHAPSLLMFLGVFFVLLISGFRWLGLMNLDDALAFGIGLGVSCFAGAWITSHIQAALRDRVLAIFVLAIFVVFFWAAFEQAGNAMNVWADQTTDRYLTNEPPPPSVYPVSFVATREMSFGQIVREAFARLVRINPVLTTSFQSINALAIVLLAPIFAWLWVYLSRRNISPSIATKMATGVFLQGIAFALMIWSVKYENGPSSTRLAALPPAVFEQDGDLYFRDAPSLGEKDALEKFKTGTSHAEEKMIAHGGRLSSDAASGALNMRGVLDANHRDRVLRATAPKEYVEFVWNMAKQSKEAKERAKAANEKEFTLMVKAEHLPPGYDPKYLTGFNPKEIRFDETTNTFIITKELADQDYKQILVAGANPEFRTALNDLWVQSTKYRVSSSWLLWFYVLCTLGELCLSPVGLSMVSKLAPRRFATMLMGMWLLTSFFGNFTAGLAGENWEKLDPGTYFTYVTLAMIAASAVCYLIARKVTSMMHGVK